MDDRAVPCAFPRRDATPELVVGPVPGGVRHGCPRPKQFVGPSFLAKFPALNCIDGLRRVSSWRASARQCRETGRTRATDEGQRQASAGAATEAVQWHAHGQRSSQLDRRGFAYHPGPWRWPLASLQRASRRRYRQPVLLERFCEPPPPTGQPTPLDRLPFRRGITTALGGGRRNTRRSLGCPLPCHLGHPVTRSRRSNSGSRRSPRTTARTARACRAAAAR